MEKCGVTFLTVHGRTPTQKIKEPSNNEFLREVRQSLSIPLVANGDCRTLEDADEMHRIIGCDGVMAARYILANPTLFSGKYDTTPLECVQEWLDICNAADQNIVYSVFHHHLTFMMEKLIRRKLRGPFNSFTKRQEVYDFIDTELGIRPRPIYVPENIKCVYDETPYRNRLNDLKIETTKKKRQEYSSENTPGKFFLEKAKEDLEGSDCDEEELLQTNMFDIV